MNDDAMDALIAAFQDHLENGGPEPTLHHLGDEEKREALELIRMMKDARGIDFNRSLPSLDSLLSDIEVGVGVDDLSGPSLTLDAIRGHVVSALGLSAEPIADGAAENEGIRSEALVRCGSLRIRIQFRPDLTHTSELEDVDPRVAAGAIFGRLSDTAAVVLVMDDQDFSSVAIGPFDVDDYIGTPDGQTHQPRIVRPVLGLVDTLRSLVEELAPDLAGDEAISDVDTVDVQGIIRAESVAACDAIVAEGKKSRTEAKIDTWSKFDAVTVLTRILEDAAAGKLTEAELDARLTRTEAA
jgi:hypothetical protein